MENFKYISENTLNDISLHDCTCKKISMESRDLVFSMDFMEVCSEHKLNPFPLAHQTGDGKIVFKNAEIKKCLFDDYDLLANKKTLADFCLEDLTVLDKSGTYKLLDDLDYSTIVIGSNTADTLQIVIDLNQNALSCTGSNIQNSIYAISANNLIAIKNGTIYTSDAEYGIYANQNNKFVLRNDLTINSNHTAIKLEGENACVETNANITVSQIAINCQNAKLKIITGTVEGNNKSLLLNGGDVQVLGGNFNGSLDVTNVEEFITGGCFNTNPTAYIERHHYVEASYGLYYIQELPDLTDIELLNNTYIIGVNENLDDYELVCENVYFYSDNKTVAELSKLLTIQGLEDLTTAGEHTVTFTYDNYYSFNLVKQITINCVSVVGFEPKYDYVIESSIPELFTVYAILSNGEKLEICLTDCVSDEQIEEFVSMSHTSGEIYNFSASYAGCNDTLQINIEKLEIVSLEFEYPRQFVENQLNTELVVIFNNSDLENTYYLEYNDILIESIVDQDNNIYANLDEINKVGTYTFVVKIGLTLEWDDNLQDYVWTYSTSKTVVLKLVGADNVSDFGTEDVDVLVGQKPLFWYDTYGGEYHYDEDILDQMTYDINDFDYNTAGNYTVTFNFDGIEQTFEINVHNPNDAMYLYLSGEYIIGGINNITISGLDWDYNDINETFDFAYIIGEVPDLTVAGEYSIQYQYAGLVAQGTIKIVNSTDVEYIMASNQYFELNTDKRAKFTAIHYNGSYSEVEVTNDMIVSGDAPNYTFVGTYSFTIEYMGKTQYMTIYVYDPNDESVVEMNWNGNSYLVWTYTNNGTDFDIDVREYGLYVRVERANRTSQIVPVTKDMITFNVEYAKDALVNNTRLEISYTVTYQGRTLYGYAVLVNENMVDGMQSMCDISLIYFGGYESKIAVEKGKALEGYYLRYYYQGYSYYLPITAENMLDANSEPQSLAVAGAYTVTVNGSEQLLIVYDFDDADIDGYFYDYSVTLVENSTTEDLLDAILGRTVNVYYDFEYPYNSSTQSYSYHESFVLTEDMLGDLSQLDLSNVGYTTIFVNYNGQEVPIGITITPNVDGQTKKTYTLNLYGFNLDADMYDEYIYMSNHWYRYVVVDEDNAIISLGNGYLSQLYVVNDDSHILENFVAGEFFDKETPEEYMILNMMQGSMYKLKIYSNMFADMYEYKNSEFVYEQTMLCEVEVENDITYIIIQGTKYVADENNNLSVYVVGNITYSYEALVDGEQMRAEFREYNGEKIMYYYVLQENEYVIAGSFEWEFNQDETMIDCYMKGNPNPIVSFVFENGQVVGIVM